MSDWEKGIEEGKIIKITSNLERSKSLVSSSLKIMSFIKNIELNNENCSIALTNCYDAILELLHALLYKKGFQVLDHLSIGYYIKDVLKNNEYFNTFDRYRKIRNRLIYYGWELDRHDVEKGIKDLKSLYDFINALIKE